MSLVFSNITTKNGILQIIERNCGFGDGDITSNSTRLAQFTGDVNLAIDKVFGFMFPLGGTWQLDDSNQTDYPIVQTDIVSGQRDYSFLTDGSGNIILDIYKVMVADTSGIFHEIEPQDQQSSSDSSFYDGQNTGGVPTRYDKTGNGIFLDFIPNYNSTNGLKVFINREATYFTTSDTTKKVGFAHLFHEYFALYPSYQYCRINSPQLAQSLYRDLIEMEQAIKDYYGSREKDVKNRMTPFKQDNK